MGCGNALPVEPSPEVKYVTRGVAQVLDDVAMLRSVEKLRDTPHRGDDGQFPRGGLLHLGAKFRRH